MNRTSMLRFAGALCSLLLATTVVPASGALPNPSTSIHAANPPLSASASALSSLSAIDLGEQAPRADGLAWAIHLAELETRQQSLTLGVQPSAPTAPSHASPSAALLTLVEHEGAQATHEQLARIQALDKSAEPLRSALTRTVDAFLAFDAATRAAYAHANLGKLQALAGHLQPSAREAAPTPGALFASAGLDLGPIFGARNALLDAVQTLNSAKSQSGAAPPASCSPIIVAPAFALDTATCDDLYTQDVALSIDFGGNDVYHNNAGGSGIHGFLREPCQFAPPPPAAVLTRVGPPTLGDPCATVRHLAAALIDLGDGDDRYGDAADSHDGANGGGTQGTGFLLDAGGNDTYTAGDRGTNGGADAGGTGFLLDAAGNDTYTASKTGTNGGGNLGAGLLLDTGGKDTYVDFDPVCPGTGMDKTVVPKCTGAQIDENLCSGVDLDTVSVCGILGPLCPNGLTSPPGTGQAAVVCGEPVQGGPPSGVKSCAVYNNLTNNIYPGQNYGVVVEYDPPGPANDVALCAGPVTGPPCGAGEPGILVNNAPTCLPNLCPQGIDAGTLSACGVSLCPTGVGDPDTDQLALCDLGPLCPGGVSHADPGTLAACGHGPLCQSGVIGMPAPGQLVVVCEKAVTACSLSGDGPGDGWTVGVQGVCVGLPWVVPNGAPCPGATVNVRIYWGTTPGFTQGSTFDACF